MSMAPADLLIAQADYSDPAHMDAVLDLLDAYARDPAGGGEGLSAYAKTNLADALRQRPTLFSVLAFDRRAQMLPVGLVNCVEGFSTFACKPLVNVHDVVVAGSHRGLGIGAQMLATVEHIARQRGACKLTLEVLSGNRSAVALYQRIGFANYQLDPAMGHANFMQKWLD
ncbi:MAG: GNAT family N-acetyltransferase [Rhodoferax sp.]|uniref:GNAT family N-acetyltransferase n=1 Tax=Rhodoferax sp. TaxID=50421 RepID=UPI001B5291A0|nr:GNAT family N-acetyltransferase [Rhodoferax sp.]MBP9904466.1 GNAT family N-acetyltransferase [Rhodoferax sp.]